MMLPAAERTAQVPPACVAGMREEANPASRAGSRTITKPGVGLQDRVQRGLILPDKRAGAVVPMPIRAKREKPLDGYGKKARLSTIMSIVLHTPSSYLFDANASRGRARFLCAPDENLGRLPAQTFRRLSLTHAVLLAESTQPRCASHPETTTWKKEPIFFFPSSRAI